MSLGKADGAGLMKSAGLGSGRILLRSFCDPLSPDSLSELIASTFRSDSGSEKPGGMKQIFFRKCLTFKKKIIIIKLYI